MSHALAVSPPAPLLRTSLADRLAATRAALARVSRSPVPSQIRTDLLTAYAEFDMVRPLLDPEHDATPDPYNAACRVERRLRAMLTAIIEAPTPSGRDALATLALAMAIDAENNLSGCRGDSDREYARAARALVTLTGVELPPAFLGFGDEPDHASREAAMWSRTPHVPGWASADTDAA